MDISPSPILQELTTARHIKAIDWNSPMKNVFEKQFSKGLKIVIEKKSNRYEWKLLHDRAGLINHGDSESLDVAAQEAITYAEHKVKNQMLNGLLS